MRVREIVTGAVCALVVLCCSGQARANGTLMSWGPRDLEGMTEARWEAAKRRPAAEVLALNIKLTSWPEAYEVLLGASAHQTDKSFLRALVSQLSNRTTVKLANTSRLIVWDRITAGDIVFEGKGLQIDDDVFSVAGRANWVLTALHRKRLGTVGMATSEVFLRALAEAWTRQLEGGDPRAMPPEYSSEREGLEELRSPGAVVALVMSLQPSAAKDRLTSDCLKRLYHLDSLPKDPESPARFCNPDTYTHQMLAAITDVTGVHDAKWWKDWWQGHGKDLEWHADAAKFSVHRRRATPMIPTGASTTSR